MLSPAGQSKIPPSTHNQILPLLADVLLALQEPSISDELQKQCPLTVVFHVSLGHQTFSDTFHQNPVLEKAWNLEGLKLRPAGVGDFADPCPSS